MADPLLRVQNLCAGYGQVQVLWGVDLTVERGSIVCLVGSNGAGKSTLLRAISGLIAPSSGHVHFGKRDLTGATPDDILRGGHRARTGGPAAVQRSDRPRQPAPGRLPAP